MKKFITFVLTAAMAVSALSVNIFADDSADAPAAAEVVADAAEDGEDATAPEDGEDAAAPEDGEDAAAPEDGEDAAAPEDGEDAAAPEDGEDATAPEDGEDDPEPLDAPEAPAVVAAPAPAPAEKAKAVPTNAKVVIDGKEVAFAAYNIGGNNYFKLRDLATALVGTDAEFDVVYDTELKAIRLTKIGSATPSVYSGDGKIDATIAPGAKEATLSTRRIILPTGAWMDATDAKMTGYNIDGYTYFKLREVADVILFLVDWDKDAKVITITTDNEAVFATNPDPADDPVVDEPADDAAVDDAAADDAADDAAAEPVDDAAADDTAADDAAADDAADDDVYGG